MRAIHNISNFPPEITPNQRTYQPKYNIGRIILQLRNTGMNMHMIALKTDVSYGSLKNYLRKTKPIEPRYDIAVKIINFAIMRLSPSELSTCIDFEHDETA